MVAAHPDDETIGAGAYLARLSQAVFIHVTDGAPRDMRDASAHGFASFERYAAARRQEFLAALDAGGITAVEAIALDYPDQQASLHLAGLTRRLADLLRDLDIDIVLVHPYEGGHPDHDAASFAVHTACRLLPEARRPQVVEFTSYHAREGRIETGVFLPDGGAMELAFTLEDNQRACKERMIACFRTQRDTLQQFGTAQERFRDSPRYDFLRPPHEGQILYERFPWGMDSRRWMALARAAREELGLC